MSKPRPGLAVARSHSGRSLEKDWLRSTQQTRRGKCEPCSTRGADWPFVSMPGSVEYAWTRAT